MNLGLGFKVEAKYKVQLRSVETGEIVKEYPWVKNLINDEGLERMAGKSGGASPANAFVHCGVGSSTSPTSFASGGVTFTQAATSAVSASAPFFTSSMVGMVLKYGTGSGGYEQYIATFIDSQHVTVQASPGGFQTVVAVVGTVWAVNTTNLAAFLYDTATYVTTAGANSTTTTGGNTLVLQRTFNFGVKPASYTVNEIGWSNAPIAGPAPVGGASQGPSTSNNVFGRTVLPSSVVVGTANFLTVVIVLSITYSPNSPTAVGNVNTNPAGGALNTAGNAMIEYFATDYIDSTGATQSGTDGQVLCADFSGGAVSFILLTTTYSQQTSISGAIPPAPPGGLGGSGAFGVACGAWTYVAATTPSGGSVAPGTSTLSFSGTFTTAGQTIKALAFRTGAVAISGAFDIILTTPFVLPTGSFPVSGTLTCVYSRTLVN